MGLKPIFSNSMARARAVVVAILWIWARGSSVSMMAVKSRSWPGELVH